MLRSPIPGLPGGLVEVSHWRRLVAALGAIAAVALAIGIILGTGLPGSSSGASPPAKASGATTVQRRDLIATDTESGTLSYATPQSVFNRMTGTITWLPTIGQVIKPGRTLYKVDGAPVVLFNGTVPAYRDLSEGVSDGLDVQELKQNLVALGFDPSHQITINQTFDSATTAAVERWQSAVGETQTGTVTLGQAVFLPGPQRITSVDTKLGSTGASSSSGSGSSGSGSGSSGSGSGTGASTTVAPPRPEFVSLTTTTATTTTTPTTATTPTPTCPGSASQTSTPPSTTKTTPPDCPTSKPSGKGKPGVQSPTTLAALLALLKAETLELKKSGSSPSSSGAGGRSAGGGTGSGGTGSASASGRSGGGGGSGAGAASTGAGGSSGSGSSGGGSSGSGSSGSGSSGSGTAQEILQTTSTQLVVTVALDATKQTEAVVGEAVTVQLPDGSTSDGKITQVSPVAQSSSSSSSSSGTGGSGSSTPSATVPVTITLTGHRPATGLDQAAVSVNFEQQKATGVLSVPVTALLATAGGGYAVQEATAPHSLIPVTPGLFAAGYVQISGSQIYSGLQVTDSQG